jgi:hypothetical protein
MALVASKECGEQISDQALSCPHCGFSRMATPAAVTHEQITNMSAVLLIVGIVLLVVVAAGVMALFDSLWAGGVTFVLGGIFVLWLTTRRK